MIKNVSEVAKNALHLDAIKILEEGLKAADPINAVRKAVRVSGGKVFVGRECVTLGRCVHIVGFGKASVRMARGLIELVGSSRVCGGAVIAPEAVGMDLGNVSVLRGDHPIPGDNTLASTEEVLRYIRSNRGPGEVFFVLISGGGSALFEKPLEPLRIEDIAVVNKLLLRSGADIYEVNAVRKHLSSVKGGRLARLLKPSTTVSLIISDVVGDRVDTIASGPTAPDSTTYSTAYDVLKNYGLWGEVPGPVRDVITMGLRGLIPETPKPGDPVFKDVANVIIASNLISLRAMAAKARELGYTPVLLTSMMEGEAREVGRFIAGIARHVRAYGEPVKPPVALLFGGETTVTVRGEGVGGRNQELVLAFAIHAAGVKDAVLASIGSDGKDGVSDAAGGIVDGGTLEEARSRGLNLREFLRRNDSYTVLKELGRAIFTGLTGTNVNDLAVLLLR